MQSVHSASANLGASSYSSAVSGIKWTEVLSLGALNAAIAISWIAYLEYQPILLQKFQVTHLGSFLVVSKAVILVIIPILAGWVADTILARKGKFFIVYMVGISTTAMIFMVVASIIAMGPGGMFAGILPAMIIFWLISMSVFISPAFSMIERFASSKNLPTVMGVIILITELIYSLEPIVQELVRFFGDTLTFIVGGILVLGTGYFFQRVSSDEVLERTEHAHRKEQHGSNAFGTIALLGLVLGAGRAFLVEYLPVNASLEFLTGKQWAFIILGIAAIFAFGISRTVSRLGTRKFLRLGILGMATGIVLISLFPGDGLLFITGSILLALAVGLAHVCALPFAFRNLTPRRMTFGIGIFLGAAAVTEGLFEIFYALQG